MINPGIICNLHLYYCLDESAQGETLVGTAKRWPKPLHFSVEVLNKANSQYFWVCPPSLILNAEGAPQKAQYECAASQLRHRELAKADWEQG